MIEFVVARWNERYGFPENEARAFMEEHLVDGHALLLLDALDETVIGESEEIARESYRRVLTGIDQMATHFQKTPIVVTARKAGYHQRSHLNGFTELEVLELSARRDTAIHQQLVCLLYNSAQVCHCR